MIERWINIVGYYGAYQVSNLGEIRSIRRVIANSKNIIRTIPMKILKQHDHPATFNPEKVSPYKRVELQSCGITYTMGLPVYRKAGRPKKMYVHRLVAEAFLLRPLECTIVNHINNNHADNRVTNLEWVTQQENVQHAYENGHNTRKRKNCQ